jgi:hypothetical protein
MKRCLIIIIAIIVLIPLTLNAQSIYDLDLGIHQGLSGQDEEGGFVDVFSVGPDFGFYLIPTAVFSGLRLTFDAVDFFRFGAFGCSVVDIDNYDTDLFFFDNITTYFGGFAGLFYRVDKFTAGFDFSVGFAYNIMLYPRIFIEYDIVKALKLGIFGGYMMTTGDELIHNIVGGITIRFNIYF